MKSDYSRITFDPRKHFSSVRMQQGRVQVDADSNEQIDMVHHRIEVEADDVIGLCGAPLHCPAFHIVADLSKLSAEEQKLPENKQPPDGFTIPDFLISAGRYYVDGILCENEQLTSYLNQPDLLHLTNPALPQAISTVGWYLVYVDVWRRLQTALDDPSMREIALGGPDTATREKTVWQIKHWLAGNSAVNCETKFPDFEKLMAPSDGKLSARTKLVQASTDPCIVPPGAGYTGLENQLYRIEIHDGGETLDVTSGGAGTLATKVPNKNNEIKVSGAWQVGQAIEIYSNKTGDDPMNGTLAYITKVEGVSQTLTLDIDVSKLTLEELRVRQAKATFKWSRDNGVVVTTIENISGKEVTGHDLGRDDTLGFQSGQWVEISDDAIELNGLPGQLAQIIDIDSAINLITLNIAPSITFNKKLHPKLRRWDGIGAAKFHPNVSADHFLDLESGVQVRFFKGGVKTGDYWTIPARTATADTQSGNIEWPRDGSNPVAQLPFGIKHHYCRLAILHWDGSTFDIIQDCRNLFPPITELTSLFYVSGENQEVMPDPTQSAALLLLPQPLIVGVANGTAPVVNAEVRFHVTTGNGQILPNGALGTFRQIDPQTLDVLTDQNGLASCIWQVDSTTQSQQLKATLQAVTDLSDASDHPVHLPVVFTANLSVASQVAYNPGTCATLLEDKTVQKAIDRLSHLISLYEVSGNNQEVMPGEVLQPLVVLAGNRCGPIIDQQTQVQFNVISGGGTVSPVNSGMTDVSGHAFCAWQPGATDSNQEVQATLVTDAARPGAPPTSVRFTCNLSTAKHVFYDPSKCPGLNADRVVNVQDAIDHLCEAHQGGCCDVTVGKGGQFGRLDEAITKLIKSDQADICICLLAGDHRLPERLEIAGDKRRPRIKIVGCGRGSRLIFPRTDAEVSFRAIGLISFTLRDVEVFGENLLIEFKDCEDITFEGCYLTQENQTVPFIIIDKARSTRFRGNVVDALLPITGRSFSPSRIFKGIRPLVNLFKLNRAEFEDNSFKVASELASQPAAERGKLAAQLSGSISDLTTREVNSYTSFVDALNADSVDGRQLQASLADIRVAALRAAPGTAIVLMDAQADAWIEDNDINGVVSLYGLPGSVKLTPDDMKKIGSAVRDNNRFLEFSGSQSQLHVRNNNLYRIDVSESLITKLKKVIPSAKTSIEGLYRRCFITDNEFDGGDNVFVMEHLALTSSSFEAGGDAGQVIANAAIYTSNYAPDDIRLFNAARSNQKGTNLTINIVDV